MKMITTLLSGAAMAACLSTPVLAGGKSNTGSATTVPTTVTAVTNRLKINLSFSVSAEITSSEVASLISALRSEYSREFGISEDQLDIEITSAQ